LLFEAVDMDGVLLLIARGPRAATDEKIPRAAPYVSRWSATGGITSPWRAER